MEICIENTMVAFGYSLKSFNGQYLERSISVNIKSAIVNKPYVLLPPPQSTSMQYHNTRISTYTNKKNDTYKGMIWKKQILFMRTMMKRNKTQGSADSYWEKIPPTSTKMVASYIFTISGDGEIGHTLSPLVNQYWNN